jgi:L-alanine-DL-glutamate epimerase-like enolase superfamily enzyme
MDCRSPKEQAQEANKAIKRGWKSLKIKLGTDPDTDVERARQIREAVGNRVELCFDINGGYPLAVAIRTIKRISKYEPAYIEDPVPQIWPYDSGCLDNMADVRKMTGVPIECHSHGPNCLEFLSSVIQKRAADAIHLNISFVGSVLECKRICAIAEAGGLIVTGQSSCAELGPRNALLLHMITSERAFKGTNDSSTHHLETPSGDIIKTEFRTDQGTLKAPEEPGLGVEVDLAKVQKYNKLYLQKRYLPEQGLGRTDSHLWW